MKEYVKDRLLIRSIEAHKRIINDGQNVDLESIGFEKGTPLDRVVSYNTFTILTKMNFPKDEATKSDSKAATLLNELSKHEPSETIIKKLVEYREEVKN